MVKNNSNPTVAVYFVMEDVYEPFQWIDYATVFKPKAEKFLKSCKKGNFNIFTHEFKLSNINIDLFEPESKKHLKKLKK